MEFPPFRHFSRLGTVVLTAEQRGVTMTTELRVLYSFYLIKRRQLMKKRSRSQTLNSKWNRTLKSCFVFFYKMVHCCDVGTFFPFLKITEITAKRDFRIENVCTVLMHIWRKSNFSIERTFLNIWWTKIREISWFKIMTLHAAAFPLVVQRNSQGSGIIKVWKKKIENWHFY